MATFERLSQWRDLDQVVNGETKIDEATVNQILRILVSRTDYLDNHLQSLMAQLRVFYDDTQPQEQKEADPIFFPSALNSLSRLDLESRGADPTAFPPNKALVTDAQGKPQWIDRSELGGGSQPTPEGLVTSIVYLEENFERVRRGNGSSAVAPIVPNTSTSEGLFAGTAWNSIKTWGESVISKFYYLNNSAQWAESPAPSNGRWGNNNTAPMMFTLKRGTYMIDAIANLVYCRVGQCRFAKVRENGQRPTESGLSEVDIHKTAIYGSNTYTSRLTMPSIDRSLVAGGNSADVNTTDRWVDAITNTSVLSAIITEDFFEGKDEIEVAFQLCSFGANQNVVTNTGGNFDATTIVWGLPIAVIDASGNQSVPPATYDVLKRLRLQKIG